MLRAVAEVCQNTIRSEDIACRYGGEELTIILPEMTEESAYMRAENIRRAISELRVQEGNQFYGEVTVSIGVNRSRNEHVECQCEAEEGQLHVRAVGT